MNRKMRKIISVLPALLLCAVFGVCALAEDPAAGQTEDQMENRIESQTESLTDSPAGALSDDEQSVEEGLLRIGLAESVPTMDVHKTSGDYMIPLNIYERLFDIEAEEDGSTRLVNGLAEDFSVSEDGLTYSFTLREDAFFSDGTPVKASDVAFTFSRMLSLPGSQQTDFADMILGAKAVMAGEADTPEGIRVLDDRHIEITLEEPFTGYIYQLATPSCSILSEANVTAAGEDFGKVAEKTIGSGPYMVTEFTENKITLEQNPFYHCHDKEKLSAKKVQILVLAPAIMDRTFQAGGLDILDTGYVNPDAVENTYKKEPWKDRLISRSCVEIRYLMLNVNESPLDDVRIRKAVQMAINRQRILDELYGGDGMLLDGIYPMGLIGFSEANQGWLEYDPEEAARLIKEVPGAGEVRLELAANSQGTTRALEIMEMIRQDLSAVGLNVVIVNYDDASISYLRRMGQLMAYVGKWSADYNDPDNFIYTFFGSREKTRSRSSNYSDMDVLDRVAAARTIPDQEKRLQEYDDLEMILVRDNAVWVPLLSAEHQFVLGERVESFTPFWAGWSAMYFRDVVLS